MLMFQKMNTIEKIENLIIALTVLFLFFIYDPGNTLILYFGIIVSYLHLKITNLNSKIVKLNSIIKKCDNDTFVNQEDNNLWWLEGLDIFLIYIYSKANQYISVQGASCRTNSYWQQWKSRVGFFFREPSRHAFLEKSKMVVLANT